ncbi:MAG TPA: CoA pyrophosphatase [Caldithrix abyssi]|uniref:CoA pyrophosphatase n=1 Tax=Caldithrix abyssi TaxID=187145 RepID=A0A7V4U4B4_CALAY|nr:CoA pyrophosphatase [Caldithrix abyssi]
MKKNTVDPSGFYHALCHSEKDLKKHIRSKLTAHKPRRYIYKDAPYTEAAVLIPIFFKDGQAHVLFTRRTEIVEHHKGQVSFPGGKRDETDTDLLTTALRESEEEVGLQSDDVTILGQTDVFLTNTHYLVTPYVGFFPYPYNFKISRGEIAHLIETPLLHLMQDRHFEIKPWQKGNETWMVHFYYFNDETIWGVTGFLLSNFLSVVFGLERNNFEVKNAR